MSFVSATRLLVLGVIRIMQPVHGYDVRRELVSWRVEELANVKPGSIYSAIRTLERDGCIAVHSRASEDSRPERTSYELTAALRSRISQLQATLVSNSFIRGTIRDGATGADGQIPEHVREILDFVSARTKAELDWTRTLQRRLREGAYCFAG